MRGYLSFLLVLCIMVCIFAFLQPFPELHSNSEYKAIEAERTHAVSMNIKETLTLSTSYWLRASATTYDLLPDPKDGGVGRRLAIQSGILSGWALLPPHQFDQDFEVIFWCGKMSQSTKQKLIAEMIEKKQALPCPSYTGTFPAECADFIAVSRKPPMGENTTVRLASADQSGRVGASIYSPKYGTANVVYIPTSQVIE